MPPRYTTFDAFWPHYLREHAQPATRWWHFLGTTAAAALLIVAAVLGRWWIVALMPIAGYGLAWLSHAVIERNRPATFSYPLWSLRADLRMWRLMLIGRLQPEVDRALAEQAATSGERGALAP